MEQKLNNLLNDFANVLEQDCISQNINKFAFPLFKPFNFACFLTPEKISYTFAQNQGGISTLYYMDLRNIPSEPSINDLMSTVTNQLGWQNLSIISFPVTVLESNETVKLTVLHQVSKEWIDSAKDVVDKHNKIVKINPIFRGRDFIIDEKLCFILMPFKEPFNRIYEKQIKSVVESFHLNPLRADGLFTPTAIVEDIWEHINKARIVIADVTGKNPNVFYELGIAHTIGKNVIIITQNKDDVPFDVGYLRYLLYTDNEDGWKKLSSDLTKTIDSILKKELNNR
jgi:hypothetical protein